MPLYVVVIIMMQLHYNMAGQQLFVELSGWSCLVVGGGPVAHGYGIPRISIVVTD